MVSFLSGKSRKTLSTHPRQAIQLSMEAFLQGHVGWCWPQRFWRSFGHHSASLSGSDITGKRGVNLMPWSCWSLLRVHMRATWAWVRWMLKDIEHLVAQVASANLERRQEVKDARARILLDGRTQTTGKGRSVGGTGPQSLFWCCWWWWWFWWRWFQLPYMFAVIYFW